ncbi:DMT family transporter [Scandinavium manionii]|uniref:DMT family transporter n=1 Tax=Scandinavium manionii TaxID=2926520 RepID=UPI00135C3411|nr:EamA family transporter [Scandinavium manionii]MCS2146786.1 DMT family transporter [Scandinavium manionii]
MKKISNYYISIVVAVIAAFSMGTIGLFSKFLGLNAEIITFFRLLLGGVFVVIFTVPFYKAGLFFRKPDVNMLVSGALLASFILFYIQSIQIAGLIVSVMTLYLAPVLAMMLSQIFRGEKITRSSYASVCGVLIGFFMVLNIFNNKISMDLYHSLYSIIAMLCYAGFILTNKETKKGVPLLVHSGVQLLVGAIVIFPFVSLDNIMSLSSGQWLWLLVIGFVPGFLGLACAIYAIQNLSTVTYATISYVEPISTLFFAWFIFNEPLTITQLIGCVLIILFSLYQVFNEKKHTVHLALQ